LKNLKKTLALTNQKLDTNLLAQLEGKGVVQLREAFPMLGGE